MTLKNILVHVDSNARSMARIDLATSLARRSDARLVGVFGQRAHADHVGIIVNWPPEEYTASVELAREMFVRATAGLLNSDWHDINRGSEREVLKQITDYSRYGDLMVFGQQTNYMDDIVPQQLAEEVAISSGRPVLVVPRSGDFPNIGRRPLIVWNGSRESARALNDSLALIEKGADAILLSLANTDDEARQASIEVERHLACHGISAQKEVYSKYSEGTWELILNLVANSGADLLVMGAHEHIGFPFISCDVVHKEAPIPVLTSS